MQFLRVDHRKPYPAHKVKTHPIAKEKAEDFRFLVSIEGNDLGTLNEGADLLYRAHAPLTFWKNDEGTGTTVLSAK
jgi:hypothetical protein